MIRTNCLFVYGMVLMLAASCASPKSTTVSSQGSGYSEDLSIWRPKSEAVATPTNANGTTSVGPKQTQYVEPKYAVNTQLYTVLEPIDRINSARKFIDGFTIQVYPALKCVHALNAKKSLATSFRDLSSEDESAQ